MNVKFYFFFVLIVIGMNVPGKSQVTYNKRAIGSIGTVPKAGDFLNDASLDAVDMATGALKISIPLYEIKVNDISVPISLNYTATGIKVGQEAGPAGMGWELNAGGKITSNIQGKDDNKPGAGLQSVGWPSNIYNDPNVFDPFGNDRTLTMDIVDGKRDGAWDTFSYSFPAGGGTYVKNGLTFPYDPLITIQHPNVIKTTDGLTYNYTSGDHKQSKKRTYYEPNAAQPYYIGDAAFSRDPQTSDWFDYDLAQIVSSKFKDTVNFTYEDITDTTRLGRKARVSTSESIPFYRNVAAVSDIYGGAIENASDRIYQIGEPVISQSKTEYLAHTRIKAIVFPNGKIGFDYGNDILGRDVLVTIRIYEMINGVPSTLKRYEFIYDETELSYGHYLKAIDVYDSKDIKVNSWGFGYYSKVLVPPNQQSNAQDRWGFYNGAITNKTLLEHPDSVLALRIKNHYPIVESAYAINSKYIYYTRPEALALYGMTNGSPYQGTTRYRINFANRQFLFNEALRGTLTSVKMPAGGTVSYEYEPHKYHQYIYQNGTSTRLAFAGGGIRIKSITKSLGHDSLYTNITEGKVIKKKYTYGEGFYEGSLSADETNGYGNVTIPGNVLGNVSKYFNSFTFETTDYNNIMLLSHPVNNMSQYNGSYAIYPSVTESLMKANSDDTYGKTVYYNRVPVYGDAPDRPWQIDADYWSLDNIKLPVLSFNPGVEKEKITGTYGIKKFIFKGGVEPYAPIEETLYTYRSFSAPLSSQTKLLSFFCTLTGQLSGPLPNYTSTSVTSDLQHPNDEGTLNLYNSLGTSGGGGIMDYLSRTRLVQEGNTPNYPGKYAYSFIDLATLSNCIKKESEQTMVYDDQGNTLSNTVIKYEYGNSLHLLPTRTMTVNSKGDSVITHTKYPQDYTGASYPLNFLITNKIALSEPVEEFSNYKTGSAEYIKQGTVNTFRVENNTVYNDKVYRMKVPGSVAFAGPYYNKASNTVDNNIFKPQLSYDKYIKGNIAKYTESGGSANAVIWGYNNQYPIAKIGNAGDGTYSPNDDVAYTSFETPSDTLNWKYAGVPVQDQTSPSGKKSYALATGPITKKNSSPSMHYLVSYWYKTGAVVNISGGTVGAAVIRNTRAGWTLAERQVSALSGTLTLSGTGNIDELRFHPYDAQMTTYLYEPLVGLSCVIDPKGKLQYYEYDQQQRLKNIRDQQGNILKGYQYITGSSN